MEEGYDMTKDNVPVTPAQHYMMGGVKTDTNGVTSMKNLYAVGETACNGVHGKNRLASNSLLESLVLQSVQPIQLQTTLRLNRAMFLRLTLKSTPQRKKYKKNLNILLWTR